MLRRITGNDLLYDERDTARNHLQQRCAQLGFRLSDDSFDVAAEHTAPLGGPTPFHECWNRYSVHDAFDIFQATHLFGHRGWHAAVGSEASLSILVGNGLEKPGIGHVQANVSSQSVPTMSHRQQELVSGDHQDWLFLLPLCDLNQRFSKPVGLVVRIWTD